MNIFANNYDFEFLKGIKADRAPEPKHIPIDSIVENNQFELGVLQSRGSPPTDFEGDQAKVNDGSRLLDGVVKAIRQVRPV